MSVDLPEPLQQQMAALRSQGIHSVLTQFTDLHGVAKGKLVPLQHLPTPGAQAPGGALGRARPDAVGGCGT